MMDLPGGLVLPVPTMLKGPVELDGPGTGTVIDTGPAIPALFRVQDNRWFAFLRMGYIHVYRADLYAMVAPVTNVGVE